MWQLIVNAPFDLDLQLAVIDSAGDVHALVFPCRRSLRGWTNVQTGSSVQVRPTHWRKWTDPVEVGRAGDQERLAVIEEYVEDLRAIVKRDRESN